MKQKLFQFAVLYHETIDKGNGNKEVKSKVVIEPKTLLAIDDKVALLQIAKQIPDEYESKLQDVEILLRPF
jgi:hypothetical protein